MRTIIVSSPKLDPCWLAAPSESLPGYFEAFAGISTAVQTALRNYLPAAYFEDLASFRDPKAAYAVLVYQASRPFRCKIRTDLTHDVLNPKMLASLTRKSKPSLIILLVQAEERLRAAGTIELAANYAPKHASEIMKSMQRVGKSRKSLYLLIRGEGVLVDTLTQLSGFGSLPAKEQTRRTALFRRRWNAQLRRLCPGQNFAVLAPNVLDAATHALQSYLDKRSGVNSGVEPGIRGV
jgi:hypothetical protein